MGIFFNRDSLILSLPLILLCSTYTFFKYVPLQYGVPVVISAGLLLQLRAKMAAGKVTRAQREMDERLERDLAIDEERMKSQSAAKAAKKQNRSNEKTRQRAAAVKRNGGGGNGGDEEDDDDADVTTFAKGGRGKPKKK